MTDVDLTASSVSEVDRGLARAGAAAAARRRELNISQRRLAADGVINAGALIAFEKGRSWPRERTRAKLEEVLRWPPGTIARLRDGHDVTEAPSSEPPGPPSPADTVHRDPGRSDTVTNDEVPLVAQAVLAAVNTLGAASEALPALDHPDFTPRLTKILADLRQLETVAARAARISRVSPRVIKALSVVRRSIDELTMRGARAPHATLGQRLYAARRGANLTIEETAQAAGVPADVVIAAEADEPVSATAVAAIETLIAELD
ncbi:transcriptional regulator [Mycolicibacterium thermoresistibile]